MEAPTHDSYRTQPRPSGTSHESPQTSPQPRISPPRNGRPISKSSDSDRPNTLIPPPRRRFSRHDVVARSHPTTCDILPTTYAPSTLHRGTQRGRGGVLPLTCSMRMLCGSFLHRREGRSKIDFLHSCFRPYFFHFPSRLLAVATASRSRFQKVCSNGVSLLIQSAYIWLVSQYMTPMLGV